jgi:REP element-mobilizing transposase RayT
MHDDLGASDDMAYGQLGLRSRLPTLWSRSYYAGSVGAVSEAVVRRYIEAQKGA